jgi:small subunit ribosomal protein S1
VAEEKAVVKAHRKTEADATSSSATTIGDLIKAQMDK